MSCKPARVLLHSFFFVFFKLVSLGFYIYMYSIVAIWRENMLGYLSADIICSEKRTVSYEEQIMSKDKYPSIFSPQMATFVFIILRIFFATRAIFKIGEYSRIFPSFSWGILGHVTPLGQLSLCVKT